MLAPHVREPLLHLRELLALRAELGIILVRVRPVDVNVAGGHALLHALHLVLLEPELAAQALGAHGGARELLLQLGAPLVVQPLQLLVLFETARQLRLLLLERLQDGRVVVVVVLLQLVELALEHAVLGGERRVLLRLLLHQILQPRHALVLHGIVELRPHACNLALEPSHVSVDLVQLVPRHAAAAVGPLGDAHHAAMPCILQLFPRLRELLRPSAAGARGGSAGPLVIRARTPPCRGSRLGARGGMVRRYTESADVPDSRAPGARRAASAAPTSRPAARAKGEPPKPPPPALVQAKVDGGRSLKLQAFLHHCPDEFKESGWH